MGPFIDERLENEKRYGSDWPDRPVGYALSFIVVAVE
jgi:hypothetical protein